MLEHENHAGTPLKRPDVVAHGHGGGLGALALGALGVVFGDIGTSPLYTLKECTSGPNGTAPENILGVLSLIFWALMLVVTLKYLTFIMRADNHGEGGILALLALIPERAREAGKGRIGVVAVLVVAGAALLYGDGIITPAISVLSAMEGIQLAAPISREAIVGLTCVILMGLFSIQSRGTGTVGKLFAPVMILWFLTIAALGVAQIVKNPAVLWAISPTYAVGYFQSHGLGGFTILGAVVLAVTGGEALYADMGHFGARAIRVAWLALVLPSLILAYFGQGALLLHSPSAQENPFFSMVPAGTATYLLVALSGAATVIASQALISGAFSLTHQAIQLGYFPRVTVRHTSRETEGQIYVPAINWGLAIACILLVLTFRESSRLAAAYGIAVSGTMAITSVAYYVVTRRTWHWPLWKALPLMLLFLASDIPFLLANGLKFMEGGYVPMLVGAVFLIVMLNWRIGRSVLYDAIVSKSPPIESFLANLDGQCAARVPGTAVFMASSGRGVPPVMLHQVRRIKALHEKVVLVTVDFTHAPAVAEEGRATCESLGSGFHRVIAHYGFMERPDIPAMLAALEASGALPVSLADATYFVGRETFIAGEGGEMGRLSEALFAVLSRNAKDATSYFAIPHEQVVELGTRIDL